MKQWNNRTPQQWDQNFKNVHVHSIQATLYCQDRSYIQKLRQSVWATDSVCCRGIVTLNLPILGNWSWMICLLQGDRHNEICSCSDGWNVIISLFTVDEICLERGNRFVRPFFSNYGFLCPVKGLVPTSQMTNLIWLSRTLVNVNTFANELFSHVEK